MPDFTSALYLGLRHGHASLRPWRALTTGRPGALAEPPGAREAAAELAALMGCEAATLVPSTLHLFWDLFGVVAPGGASLHLDAGAYAVARWGAERARGRGVPVRAFRHHDAEALRRSLHRLPRGARPVVVADGFCPGCGRAAPVPEYLAAVRERGGLLVLDDTQALGVLGEDPGPGAPYGRGGGGTLRRFGIAEAPDILVGASLAKGFGVPGAVLAGSRLQLAAFEARSQTRVHCSPPSLAVVAAAEAALRLNTARGDALRLGLARRVARFRRRLAAAGVRPRGGLFPVQTVGALNGRPAEALHARLEAAGVRTVLLAGRGGKEALVGFLITAAHRPDDIHRAADALLGAAGLISWRKTSWHTETPSALPRAG